MVTSPTHVNFYSDSDSDRHETLSTASDCCSDALYDEEQIWQASADTRSRRLSSAAQLKKGLYLECSKYDLESKLYDS